MFIRHKFVFYERHCLSNTNIDRNLIFILTYTEVVVRDEALFPNRNVFHGGLHIPDYIPMCMRYFYVTNNTHRIQTIFLLFPNGTLSRDWLKRPPNNATQPREQLKEMIVNENRKIMTTGVRRKWNNACNLD